MKRAIGLVLLVAVVFSLVACKRSEVQNVGVALDEWRTPPKSEPTPEPMDVEVYTDADFSKDLGIDVVSLPDAGQITPNKFFALDGWFGQIEFTTADNFSLNVRLARAEDERLSGTYAEGHVFGKETRTIDGLEVTVATATEGCALVTWVRGEVQYALHSNKKQGVPPAALIEAMVKGLDARVVGPAAASAEENSASPA